MGFSSLLLALVASLLSGAVVGETETRVAYIGGTQVVTRVDGARSRR